MILVADVDCVSPVTLQVETLRLTSGTHFSKDGYAYRSALTDEFSFSQELFSKGTTRGAVSVGIGDLTIINMGELDRYKNYGFVGQRCEVWWVQDEDSVIDETTDRVLGVIGAFKKDWETYTLSIEDARTKLDVLLQPKSFEPSEQPVIDEGDPLLLEGVPAMEGAVKIRTFGYCFNVPLAPLNRFWQLYGANFDREGAPAAVYAFHRIKDKGGDIFFYKDYATVALLMAALTADPPPGGYYSSCRAQGIVALAAPAVGEVTADIQTAPLPLCTAASVVARELEAAGLEGVMDNSIDGDFSLADLAQLDAVAPYAVGYVCDGDESVLDFATQVLDSVGAWVVPEPQGLLRFGRMLATDDMPEPIGQVINEDIFFEGEVAIEATDDGGDGIPAKQVRLGYNRVWKVQSPDSVLEALWDGRKQEAKEEFYWRTLLRADVSLPDVSLIHPRAPELEQTTLLSFESFEHIRNGDFTGFEWGWTESTAGSGMVVFTGVSCELELLGPLVPLGSAAKIEQTIRPASMPSTDFNGAYRLTVIFSSGATSCEIDFNGTTLIPSSSTGSFSVTANLSGASLVRLSAHNSLNVVSIVSVSVQKVENPMVPIEPELERRAAILMGAAERFLVSVPLALAYNYVLGRTVVFQAERLELDEGKSFVVIGKDIEYNEEEVGLDLLRIEA